MRKTKGITLIALVITIIVMIILVGVTINIAVNSGLFDKSREAKEQTQMEINKEALLSALVEAIGSDGEIDYEVLDARALSLGFAGEEGEYTKDGYTYTLDETTKEIIATKTTGGGEINAWKAAGLTTNYLACNYYYNYAQTGLWMVLTPDGTIISNNTDDVDISSLDIEDTTNSFIYELNGVSYKYVVEENKISIYINGTGSPIEYIKGDPYVAQ